MQDKPDLAKFIGMVCLGVCMSSTAYALEVGDRIEIHGYGYLGYLQTTDNVYLNADKNGTWDFNVLALLFTAKINNKSKAWMQSHSTTKITRLDWAYVDYQLTSNLTGRVGQIKKPMGLYNEIRHVKFLHLSTLEPLLYQEDAAITEEAFRGISGVYNHNLGSGSLSWDAYLGQVVEAHDEDRRYKSKRLVGGRLTYKTPVEGLKFMGSVYNSATDDAAQVPVSKGAKKVWVLSADYDNNNFDVKAEYAQMEFFNENSKTYYLQVGYTFAEKWTPFVRSDYISTNEAQKTDPAYSQKTKVLGLNYKINDNIAVRLENHWNQGYALPVASGEVAAGTGKKDWNLLATSISFIF